MVETVSSSATKESRTTHRTEVTRQWVRPSDVSVMTGLSPSTVFRALYSGELQGHQRGRSWLIPLEAVTAWVRGE